MHITKHIQTHTQNQTQTLAHTNTHTQTHTYTYTHTNTHKPKIIESERLRYRQRDLNEIKVVTKLSNYISKSIIKQSSRLTKG